MPPYKALVSSMVWITSAHGGYSAHVSFSKMQHKHLIAINLHLLIKLNVMVDLVCCMVLVTCAAVQAMSWHHIPLQVFRLACHSACTCFAKSTVWKTAWCCLLLTPTGLVCHISLLVTWPYLALYLAPPTFKMPKMDA